MKVTFEQPKEFNQFACPSMPWTKDRIIATAKLVSPVVVLIYLSVVEIRFVKGLAVVPGLIECTVFFIPALMAQAWGLERIESRSKRTLILNEKYIQLRPCKLSKIPWRNVLCFQVEPAGPNHEWSKITVQYPGPTPSGRRYWSIILPDGTQRDALLSELKALQETGLERFTVKVSDTSVPPLKKFKARPVVLWLYLLGLYLLVHGLPLMTVFLPGEHPPKGARYEQVNPKIVAWSRRFFSKHDFRHFVAFTATTLTGLGAGSLGLAIVLERRDRRAYRAELFGERETALN